MSAEANSPRPHRAATGCSRMNAQHRVICRAEPPLRRDLQHHLPEAVGRQCRHHAHQFGDGKIGAEPHESGVERHQFLLRPARAAQEDPREPASSRRLRSELPGTGHRQRRARAPGAPVRDGDPLVPACGAATAIRHPRSRPRRPRPPRPMRQARRSAPPPGAEDISPNWPAG